MGTRQRQPWIHASRHPDEPINRTGEEVWELASDNPAVGPEPWPEKWEPVGEVVWVAYTLIEGRRGNEYAGRE